MKVENVEEFTRRFETYVTEHILPEQTSAVIDIDAEIDFRDITPKFHADLKSSIPSDQTTTNLSFVHIMYMIMVPAK